MQTNHLLIRPFTIHDAQDYWLLVSLPEVIRYPGEQPRQAPVRADPGITTQVPRRSFQSGG